MIFYVKNFCFVQLSQQDQKQLKILLSLWIAYEKIIMNYKCKRLKLDIKKLLGKEFLFELILQKL